MIKIINISFQVECPECLKHYLPSVVDRYVRIDVSKYMHPFVCERIIVLFRFRKGSMHEMPDFKTFVCRASCLPPNL